MLYSPTFDTQTQLVSLDNSKFLEILKTVTAHLEFDVGMLVTKIRLLVMFTLALVY